MINIIDFCKVWFWDFIIYPFRFFENLKIKYQKSSKKRIKVNNHTIYICIHEWGGYLPIRQKHIKNIESFTCGLKYQIERFRKDRSTYPLNLTITMSDPDKHINLGMIKKYCDNFIIVPNIGMDFSGYWNFYNSIKNKENAYVILTNSSVNHDVNYFIDDYIEYMDANPDVGILGVSNSSKYFHTFVRNNFNPHLQSFFLLTTIDILNDIVKKNGGVFPGISERNKHLLIRNGEVQISRLALKLGYNLAVVKENGKVIKFNYKSYPMKKGDSRCNTLYPNRINPIKK